MVKEMIYRYTTCKEASLSSALNTLAWRTSQQLCGASEVLRIQLAAHEQHPLLSDKLKVSDFNPTFLYRRSNGEWVPIPKSALKDNMTLKDVPTLMSEQGFCRMNKGWVLQTLYTVNGFRGKYEFLSNMYSVPVTIDFYGTERTFTCAEAAYQAFKSPTDVCQFEKLDGPAAKKLSKKIAIRPDWDQIKLGVMEYVLEAKFQNPALRTALFNTAGVRLEEWNKWRDNYWGIWEGNPEHGQNWLGKLLMQLRDKFCEAMQIQGA